MLNPKKQDKINVIQTNNWYAYKNWKDHCQRSYGKDTLDQDMKHFMFALYVHHSSKILYFQLHHSTSQSILIHSLEPTLQN